MTTSHRCSVDWRDGWLRVFVYFLVYSWTRWVSPNGLACFYRRCGAGGKPHVEGRTVRQDFLHVARAVASVVLFGALYWSHSDWFLSIALGLSMFMSVDLFAHFTMLAVFGNTYGRQWSSEMSLQRLHRTLIVGLLMLVELVFWHAGLAYGLARNLPDLFRDCFRSPSDALHYSVATVTTIGYGTFAPVHLLSVMHACVEALSALLLVTGLVTEVLTRIASGTNADNTRSSTYDLPICWETNWGWNLRRFLPIVVPLLFVALAACYSPVMLRTLKPNSALQQTSPSHALGPCS